MTDGRAAREGPTAIVVRLLWCEDTVHLIGRWESSDALDRYVATAEVAEYG